MDSRRPSSRPAGEWDFLRSAIQPIRKVLDTTTISNPPVSREEFECILPRPTFPRWPFVVSDRYSENPAKVGC